jgi:pimeloyl-ACP methyl ester carboxylesterase
VASIVLVHGSWHASWCWHRVEPLLVRRGHVVKAIDLPGHGADWRRAPEVRFKDYIDAVGEALGDCAPPRVLVVHSWGGIGCAVAERWPERLAALVFIAAVIPDNGASMMQMVEQYDAAVLASFVFSEDRRVAAISADGARAFMYGLAPSEEADQAIARLTPEPAEPFTAPILTTAERFGRVPRYYVETASDRLVPLALQRAIQTRIAVRRTLTLVSDHAPLFSAPRDLAACLADVVAEVEPAAL